MSGSYREKRKDPKFFLDEVPEELNPELYETSFDWEAEERRLKEEEKEKRKEAGPFRKIFK